MPGAGVGILNGAKVMPGAGVGMLPGAQVIPGAGRGIQAVGIIRLSSALAMACPMFISDCVYEVPVATYIMP